MVDPNGIGIYNNGSFLPLQKKWFIIC
jgi:hypothetical protein